MSGASIERRALEWFASDDTGMSSETIAKHMLGLECDGWHSYPHDPADLGRCLRLLERIPEWKGRMPEMGEHSAVWARLVARWQEMRDAMEREVGIDWRKAKKAPLTYALMKEIRGSDA